MADFDRSRAYYRIAWGVMLMAFVLCGAALILAVDSFATATGIFGGLGIVLLGGAAGVDTARNWAGGRSTDG